QVQVREKEREKRVARSSNADFTRYDVTIGGTTHRAQWKRNAILLVVQALHASGVSPQELRQVFQEMGRGNAFLSVDQETDDVDEFRSLATAALASNGKRYNDAYWHTRPGTLFSSQGQ